MTLCVCVSVCVFSIQCMDQPYLLFDAVYHRLVQMYRLYCKRQKTEQGLDEGNLAIVFTGQNLAFTEEALIYCSWF